MLALPSLKLDGIVHDLGNDEIVRGIVESIKLERASISSSDRLAITELDGW